MIDGRGVLRAKAKIARIGIQNYYEDGKLIRELRLPEDVEASVESFQGQFITLNHPTEMVDSDNANLYSKGFTSNVNYIDGWLESEITVNHADAVTAAQTTHKQFSCGYWAELVDESGTWVDELGVMGTPGKTYEYDRIQKNIVGNHVALVQRARAGNKATFFDSVAEFEVVKVDELTIPQKDATTAKHMIRIVHDGQVLEIDGNDAQAVADLVSGLKTAITDQDNKLAENVATIEGLESDKSSLQGRIDGLEASAKSAPKLDESAIATETQARVEVWTAIAPHVDSEPDYSLSSLEAKKLYLKGALPDLASKIDQGDESYVSALWDTQQPEAVNHSDRVKQQVLHSQKQRQVTQDARDPQAIYDSGVKAYRESLLGGAK